jgi:hypothetical protein
MNLIRSFILILITATLFNTCNECNDCGPGGNYPFVRLRFYNIDSLIKAEAGIVVLEDSLEAVSLLISGGNNDLIPLRDELQRRLVTLFLATSSINDGEIRLEQVTGTGAQKILYFRDSLNNDSLRIFNFPLSMDAEDSQFIVAIPGRIDTLDVVYKLRTSARGQSIYRQAYGIQVVYHTYDSIRISCRADSCLSNETSISVYF